jgi:hypothetical protein
LAPARRKQSARSKSSNELLPPESPSEAMSPADDGAWHSREQLSTLLVPIATRMSFWRR